MAGKDKQSRPRVFGLRVDAVAGPGNMFAVGAKKELLLVARADSIEEAMEIAKHTLAHHNWPDATMQSWAEVKFFGEDIADLKVREVVDYAAEHGSGILVYDIKS
jgi:hypothetical protein